MIAAPNLDMPSRKLIVKEAWGDNMNKPPDMTIKLIWTGYQTPQKSLRLLNLDRLIDLREIGVEIILKFGSVTFPPWAIVHL